jgi:GNAT superfamily N-acetyltransferase
MIRLAHYNDLFAIMQIVEKAKEDMIFRSIYQWNEHYPKENDYAKDIDNKELYLFEDDKKILAAVCVNRRQAKEYQAINWLYKGDKVSVIHRLVVEPNSQGKGVAQKLIHFSEEMAKTEHKSICMRLDAFTENPRALHIYEKNNYYICGKIYFPYREIPFYAFEKILS